MASTFFGTAPIGSGDARLWPLAAPGYWLVIPLVALAYASVAAVSLTLAIPPGYASAVWPPAGIALAAWLAFGGRVWPGILLGAAVANLGVMGTPLWVALAIGAGNAAEAAVAGILIRRFVRLRYRFDEAAAVWKFAAIAFGAALVAATNGVATLALAGQVPWAEFGRHWLTWWLGDATGIIIVAPLLLCWSQPGVGLTAGERRIEYQLFSALVVLCVALLWATRFQADTVQKIAYLMIPLVTWAAARLDQRAVTAASFAISVVAILDMLDGAASMFMLVPLNESLLMLQLFVSAVALTGLTLSALTGEVVRANARLQASQDELQRRVKEGDENLDRTLAHQALLARRMVRIRDEERARLAADLHDGVAQDLSSLGVLLDLMRSELAKPSARVRVEQAEQGLTIAKRAGASLREVISGIRPPGVEGLALSSALRQRAASFEARTGILVTVNAPPAPDKLPFKTRDALVRICQEALTNIEKHADANSVRLRIDVQLRRAIVSVEDDGCGFDVAAAEARGAQAGAGLQIMRERAMAIGATLRVHSAPGAGTRIECRLSVERMD
jgi:signal transduction histidine kinase